MFVVYLVTGKYDDVGCRDFCRYRTSNYHGIQAVL